MTIDTVTAYLYDCMDLEQRFPHPEELFDKFQEVDREEIVKEAKYQARTHDLSDIKVEWEAVKPKLRELHEVLGKDAEF